jgi:hypothetical protein
MTNYNVFDSVRNHTYTVEAADANAAAQWVQNDQWQEALDPATVTDRENLHVTEQETAP